MSARWAWGVFLILATSLTGGAALSAPKSGKPVPKEAQRPARKYVYPKSSIVTQAKRLLQKRDYLGFRIWVRKAYAQPTRYSEWYELKNLVTSYANKAGFDLVPYWNARNPSGKAPLDQKLEQADALMLSGKYEEAFEIYQKEAQTLKPNVRSRADARGLYPFVLHSMARALYGARRYEEATQVYQWIGSNYPRFRQVLFEKMWAAFKAGRVEIALGAVASQRSVYFSRFLSPEAYLIQSYIYKRLCREDDLKLVVAEMKDYQASLEKNDSTDWVKGDVESLTLWRLAEKENPLEEDTKSVSKSDRERERAQIREALAKAFQAQRPRLLNDLKTAIAYTHLAKVTDTRDVLKPIEALTSREDLLKQDLEIWPADSTEEWVDEIGKHVLIGPSLCKESTRGKDGS